jgi:hypothetical protein
MKITGELAARVKHGNGEQQNTPDQDIQAYENESSRFLRKFLYSTNARLYGRTGRGTVNARI